MENSEYEAMLKASEHHAEENSARMKRDLVDRVTTFNSYLTTEIARLYRKSAGISGPRGDDWACERARSYEAVQGELYTVFPEIAPKKYL